MAYFEADVRVGPWSACLQEKVPITTDSAVTSPCIAESLESR